MILRKNILPRTVKDTVCSLFVIFIIPIIYSFELFVVIPTFYPMWGLWYNFHFLLGNFVALNLITNLVALIVIDTSVKGRLMPSEMKSGWHFCCECESIVPPRSWHCEICKTCILKRDHHCFFVGTCVGHENTRYFMMFCLYMFLATLYSTSFNAFFIWNYISFSNKWAILKLIFPLAMLAFDISINQLYIFLFLIVLFGLIFSGILFFYHLSLILSGQTNHERNFNIEGYAQNSVIKNIEVVFGKKWYLVWISPFITSKLTHNGIDWIPKDTLKTK